MAGSLYQSMNFDEYVFIDNEAGDYVFNENGENNEKSSSSSGNSEGTMGIVASPSVIFAFLLSQATTFFAFNIVQALSGLWPADLVLLATTTAAFVAWYYLVRAIDAIISVHSNPRWVDGWRKVVSFISYILIVVTAAYSIQLLRLLWISGTITVIQSIVVTVAGIFIFIFTLVSFSDQFSTKELLHLKKEIAKFLQRHVERYARRLNKRQKMLKPQETIIIQSTQMMKPILSNTRTGGGLGYNN